MKALALTIISVMSLQGWALTNAYYYDAQSGMHIFTNASVDGGSYGMIIRGQYGAIYSIKMSKGVQYWTPQFQNEDGSLQDTKQDEFVLKVTETVAMPKEKDQQPVGSLNIRPAVGGSSLCVPARIGDSTRIFAQESTNMQWPQSFPSGYYRFSNGDGSGGEMSVSGEGASFDGAFRFPDHNMNDMSMIFDPAQTPWKAGRSSSYSSTERDLQVISQDIDGVAVITRLMGKDAPGAMVLSFFRFTQGSVTCSNPMVHMIAGADDKEAIPFVQYKGSDDSRSTRNSSGGYYGDKDDNSLHDSSGNYTGYTTKNFELCYNHPGGWHTDKSGHSRVCTSKSQAGCSIETGAKWCQVTGMFN